jgi:hypothetical protein
MSREEEFLKAYQKRFEQKIREAEIGVIEYWRERLDRLITMRPDGIASLQAEMKKMSQMMKNRVVALKRETD